MPDHITLPVEGNKARENSLQGKADRRVVGCGQMLIAKDKEGTNITLKCDEQDEEEGNVALK